MTIDRNHAAYKSGLRDGSEMARESGSADAGCDGWDGMAINAVGITRLVRSFGLPEGTKQDSQEFRAAMAHYCAGCQAGADAELAEDGTILRADDAT